MRLLPHLDTVLRAYRQASSRLAEEKHEVRVGRRTYRGGPKAIANTYNCTGFTESGVQTSTPVYITVDTSLTGIRWVINQEDQDNTSFPIRFSVKVLSERQRGYVQVKRERCGIVLAVNIDKDYLIGTKVIIEMDCLPILGMVSKCATPDLAN